MNENKGMMPDAPDASLTSRDISDSIKGKAKEAKGKIEDAAGALTGDLRTQATGKLDQAKGNAQDLVGKVERSIDKKP